MNLYMLVTSDEYELPLVIADSAAELGRMLNVTANTINSSISHAKRKGKKSQYVKVRISNKEKE